MKKQRKSLMILKPVIDEAAALRFAEAAPAQSSTPSQSPGARQSASYKIPRVNPQGDMRQISLTIQKDLYERIAKDAARKHRTIEEHLIRRLAKHYSK